MFGIFAQLLVGLQIGSGLLSGDLNGEGGGGGGSFLQYQKSSTSRRRSSVARTEGETGGGAPREEREGETPREWVRESQHPKTTVMGLSMCAVLEDWFIFLYIFHAHSDFRRVKFSFFFVKFEFFLSEACQRLRPRLRSSLSDLCSFAKDSSSSRVHLVSSLKPFGSECTAERTPLGGGEVLKRRQCFSSRPSLAAVFGSVSSAVGSPVSLRAERSGGEGRLFPSVESRFATELIDWSEGRREGEGGGEHLDVRLIQKKKSRI